MAELSVTVRVGQSQPATYRFDQFPVLVGRSPECHLAICHQRVPRNLFFAWLENNGDTVRVEAVPNVTTPITVDNHPLREGVSGRQLSIAIDEVEIVLCSGGSAPDLSVPQKGRSPHGTRVRLLSLALLGVAIAGCFLSINPPLNPKDTVPGIPEQLQFPASAPDIAPESHTLLLRLQEADERLRRPTDPIPNRYRAAVLLERAASQLRSTDRARANGLSRRADHLKQELRAEYRLTRRRWLEALHSNNRDALTVASNKMLPWLEVMNSPYARTLTAIARPNKQEKHR